MPGKAGSINTLNREASAAFQMVIGLYVSQNASSFCLFVVCLKQPADTLTYRFSFVASNTSGDRPNLQRWRPFLFPVSVYQRDVVCSTVSIAFMHLYCKSYNCLLVFDVKRFFLPGLLTKCTVLLIIPVLTVVISIADQASVNTQTTFTLVLFSGTGTWHKGNSIFVLLAEQLNVMETAYCSTCKRRTNRTTTLQHSL